MTGSTPRSLYPPVEPYHTEMLSVGDGHHLYFERCGTPRATPAVFLHGGRGCGTSPDHRRLFDPERYDVLLFDQRGCGKSTPDASIENNTMRDIVNDIERRRCHFDVERWLVFGGSWGTTLGLVYAQRFTRRVSALILRGVFLLRPCDVAWFYQSGASEVFHEAWEEFRQTSSIICWPPIACG